MPHETLLSAFVARHPKTGRYAALIRLDDFKTPTEATNAGNIALHALAKALNEMDAALTAQLTKPPGNA